MKEQAFAKLTQWFTSPYSNTWGGKGYLVDRLSRELNCSKAQASRFHSEWVSLCN
jgi:hypothetical protein